MAALAFADEGTKARRPDSLPEHERERQVRSASLGLAIQGTTSEGSPKPGSIPSAQPATRTELSQPSMPRHEPVELARLRPEGEEPTPRSKPGLKFIDANIREIHDRWVIFCFENASGRANLRLPRDIVPQDILAYGQPVRITLGHEGGVRYPQIQRRASKLTDSVYEDAELGEWLNSP